MIDLDLKRRVTEALIMAQQHNASELATQENRLIRGAQNEEEYGADRTMSKSEEMMDDVEILDTQAIAIQNRLLALHEVSMDQAMDTVQAGALVCTSQGNYLIAAATEPIDLEGVYYMGTSLAAPLMQAMEGKRVGDKLTYNGREFAIKAIV